MILVVLFARRATPKIMMKKMALIKVTVRSAMMMPVNESTKDMQQINYILHDIGKKVAQKNSSNLLKELAVLEAAKIKAGKPKFCVLHK